MHFRSPTFSRIRHTLGRLPPLPRRSLSATSSITQFSPARPTTTISATWNTTSRNQFTTLDVPTRTHSPVLMSLDPADPGVCPMNMVLMGLAGCTGMHVKHVLNKKRISVKSVDVVVTGQKREGVFSGVFSGWEGVHVEVVVGLPTLPFGPLGEADREATQAREEEVQRVVGKCVEEYCGVRETIVRGVDGVRWGCRVV
ncbi:hypothetical protein HDU98_005758 [Podochytrium sp. JEL0797]|nr:hypothetical protein HDU98_005758 [Podochytrium sp. JEL0797]